MQKYNIQYVQNVYSVFQHDPYLGFSNVTNILMFIWEKEDRRKISFNQQSMISLWEQW